jgi:hypothetical protein
VLLEIFCNCTCGKMEGIKVGFKPNNCSLFFCGIYIIKPIWRPNLKPQKLRLRSYPAKNYNIQFQKVQKIYSTHLCFHFERHLACHDYSSCFLVKSRNQVLKFFTHDRYKAMMNSEKVLVFHLNSLSISYN